MPSDVQTLSTAIEHIQRLIATVLLGSVLFGVSTILFALSSTILIRRGLRSWQYGFLFATTTVMYLVATAYWVIEMVTILEIIYDPEAYAFQSSSSLVDRTTALTIFLGLNFWLSDAIIVFRTFVLWKDNKFIRLNSAFVFLVITGLNIADIVTTRSELSEYVNTQSRLPIAFANSFGSAAIVLSLGLNLWATVLISFKFWKYKSTMGQPRTSFTSMAGGSLLLLTEYGALYCIIWIVFLIFSAFRTKSQPVVLSYALDQAVVQLAGIYPMIIVVIICLRKAREDGTSGAFASERSRSQNRPSSYMNHMKQESSSSMLPRLDSRLDAQDKHWQDRSLEASRFISPAPTALNSPFVH